MLEDAIEFLRCPVCAQAVVPAGDSLRCERGHSYDIARQGYASLLAGKPPSTGDTAAMVAQRDAFLCNGSFSFIADAIVARAVEADERGAPGVVVDLGAGTGYYVSAVLDALPNRVGVAIDLSKFALRRAARAHPHLAAVAADIWRGIPMADDSAELILNVFAPRHIAEMHRILHPDGRLLAITPTDRHLSEIIEPLGLLSVQPGKWERFQDKMSGHFTLESHEVLETHLELGAEELHAAVSMGPSAHHVDPAALSSAIEALRQPLIVTASVTLSVHAARHSPGQAPSGPERGLAAVDEGPQAGTTSS